MKKQPFTLEKHNSTGISLYSMRNEILNLCIDLSRAYPIKVYTLANRVLNAIDELRSKLDDKIFEEHPDRTLEENANVYFRANVDKDD